MLSVVTVIHRSAPHLERLLASLDVLSEPPQLVVVDTGPDDGGAQLAADAGAIVVSLPDNPGFGAANNAGVARATGERTALLNPDVVLLDDGIERLGADDALHVPRLLNPDGSAQDSVHPLPGSARNLARAIAPGPVRRAIGEAAPAWATAAALVARTETLRVLGPFDPRIFLFGEDLDLCLRARERGVPTVLHRDVAVRHAGGHSTGAEDIAERLERHLAVVERRLGPAAARRERRILLVEHGLRAFRARDRAYVRAIRVSRRA